MRLKRRHSSSRPPPDSRVIPAPDGAGGPLGSALAWNPRSPSRRRAFVHYRCGISSPPLPWRRPTVLRIARLDGQRQHGGLCAGREVTGRGAWSLREWTGVNRALVFQRDVDRDIAVPSADGPETDHTNAIASRPSGSDSVPITRCVTRVKPAAARRSSTWVSDSYSRWPWAGKFVCAGRGMWRRS